MSMMSAQVSDKPSSARNQMLDRATSSVAIATSLIRRRHSPRFARTKQAWRASAPNAELCRSTLRSSSRTSFDSKLADGDMQPSDGLLTKLKTVVYSGRDQGTLMAEQRRPSAKPVRKSHLH